MADDSSKQQAVPDQVIQLMIQDILRKNGVQPEEVKRNIPDEQKQALRKMVEDLQKQVEQFNKGEKNTNKSSE
ncbi:spore coat protein [Virgibacillus sp. NKC19-3]|uniref:spore coat protein n=1 Tax=Virgibacillus saliphilus TaxID=2831674 RepID=UPI001C9AAEAE|nr:spore coat protein [Virgibacillus sp. NKC19-3]MBY7142201.1 spore coat protein [Virgibacillus sp. NKC19-3]